MIKVKFVLSTLWFYTILLLYYKAPLRVAQEGFMNGLDSVFIQLLSALVSLPFVIYTYISFRKEKNKSPEIGIRYTLILILNFLVFGLLLSNARSNKIPDHYVQVEIVQWNDPSTFENVVVYQGEEMAHTLFCIINVLLLFVVGLKQSDATFYYFLFLATIFICLATLLKGKYMYYYG